MTGIWTVGVLSWAQAETGADRAAASSAVGIQSVWDFLVNVDGGVFVGARRVEPEELSQIVGPRVAANPQQRVSIRGDRAVAYAHVVSVLDVCKAAGVSAPFLDTVPAEP